MTFPIGSVVVIPRLAQGHHVVGTVCRALGPYTMVELSDGQVIPCIGDVLKDAGNVVPLRRNPQKEMIEW